MQKKQDSDILNCVNAIVDAQISIKAILPQGGFLLIWSIWFLYFSESTNNLQSIDIYMAIFGKPHFLPYGEPQGGYFAPRRFCVDFEHMVNLFSLKYIKFAILYKIKGLIIGNFDFSPTGEPAGELSLPRGPMYNCALIVSLRFFSLSFFIV